MTDKNFDDANQKVEIVCDEHNHDLVTKRRPKGSLKYLKLKDQAQETTEEADSEREQFDMF